MSPVGRVADVLLTLVSYYKSVLKCLSCSLALCSYDFGSVAEGQHEQILGILGFSSVKGTAAI